MSLFTAYVSGFALSSVLTLASFLAVFAHVHGSLELPAGVLAATLVLLAVSQLIVQVLCFLHLSEEETPRWRLVSLIFALIVVAILVGGTVWIMANLNHGQIDYREIFKGGQITPQTQND